MNVFRAGRVPAIILACALPVLSGCSSLGTPAHQVPQCHAGEALVCYDRHPSRLEKRDGRGDLEFCHCEQTVF